MYKSLFIMTACLLVSISSYAYQTENCNCVEVFEEIVKGVEDNYLPLKLEGTGINKKAYQEHIKSYRKRMELVKPEECTSTIQGFLDFFEDEHLFVFEQPEYTDEELEGFKHTIKASKVNVEALRESVLNYQGDQKLVGFYWDGTSILAIVPNGESLEARVYRSSNEKIEGGELKAAFRATHLNYSGTYYSYNYASRYIEGGLYKQDSMLSLNGGIQWKKLKQTEIDKELHQFKHPALPYFTNLGKGTTVFTIPSFNVDYQQFIDILLENLALLKEAQNLIFDIRGNTGGNAIYFSFIDAYAQQSLKGGQGRVLASQATHAYFERLAQNSPDIYQPVVARIKNNMGEVVDGPAYPDHQYEPSKDFNFHHVAMLTDEGCMSASESFIIHSKGVNPNVQTFGKPTAGVIDYTSVNAISVASGGSRKIYFGYPTSSLHMDIPNNGFNKTGIKPDVAISEKVKDPIQFIVDYWKNRATSK